MLAVLQDVTVEALDGKLLEGVSMGLRAGRVGAVVSSRGEERSALLRLLAGSLRPSSGSVQVHGRAVLLEGVRGSVGELVAGSRRALEGGAKLVLAEAPLHAMSRADREELFGQLRGLVRGTGSSVLLTSASYDSVYGLADCIFLLWRGRLVWSGCAAEATPDDLEEPEPATVIQIDYRPIPDAREMMVEQVSASEAGVGLSLVSGQGETVSVVLPREDAEYLGLRPGQIVYARFSAPS